MSRASFAPIAPAAIVIQADRFELLRCRYPSCLALDAQHPREGWQLSFWRYAPAWRAAR